MAKFTFIAEEDGSKVTKEFSEVDMLVVLTEFKYFLKGAGYEFNGQFELVAEEDTSAWYEHEPALGSSYAFDTDVNISDNLSINLE